MAAPNAHVRTMSYQVYTSGITLCRQSRRTPEITLSSTPPVTYNTACCGRNSMERRLYEWAVISWEVCHISIWTMMATSPIQQTVACHCARSC